MRAQFKRMEWENPAQTIASFYFTPEPGQPAYRYEAGQYAVISVPHDHADSRGDSRTMTLSSSPSQEMLRFTMKVDKVAGSSFKKALLQLQLGGEVTIYDAMGDLIAPLDASIPLVFVAGGVGISSYIGIVQYLLDTNDKRTIVLLYTVARPGDIVLQQPFDTYDQRFGMTKALYCPSTGITDSDFNGKIIARRLSSQDIAAYCSEVVQIYLSGTEAMVDQLRGQLEAQHGIPKHQIAFDYFEGYTEL